MKEPASLTTHQMTILILFVINYAAFCEDNIYLSHSPIVRPFLKGVGTFAGWLAPYLYYKEPDYLLDRMWDMVRRVTGTVFGFILEFLWEIFIVVVPALFDRVYYFVNKEIIVVFSYFCGDTNTINIMAVSKKVLERMCPSHFEDAYINNNKKVLSEYMDYAKSVCGKLLQSQTFRNISNRENIIEEASNDAILYLHKKLEKYDPEKGAFSSYFYTEIGWSLQNVLSRYGYHGIVDLLSEQPDICEPEPRSSYVFSKEMIPYIRKWAEKLPDLKKRVLMARWGFAIRPELSVPGEIESTYGYATKLAQELAKSGEIDEKDIDKKANSIKSMLNDILKELRKELPKITGLRPSEIRENLYELIVTTKEKVMEKNVRDLITNLDANTLSDDEAAWLFALLFA